MDNSMIFEKKIGYKYKIMRLNLKKKKKKGGSETLISESKRCNCSIF